MAQQVVPGGNGGVNSSALRGKAISRRSRKIRAIGPWWPYWYEAKRQSLPRASLRPQWRRGFGACPSDQDSVDIKERVPASRGSSGGKPQPIRVWEAHTNDLEMAPKMGLAAMRRKVFDTSWRELGVFKQAKNSCGCH